MKVALITYHADPARGGAERYTVDLARALAARGHDVALLYAAAFAGEGMAGVRHLHIKTGGVTRAKRYRNFLDALERHLDAESYDIVHAMLPVHRCDIYQPHAGFAFEAAASGHLKHKSILKRAASRLGNRLNVKRRLYAAVERNLLTASPAPAVICLSHAMKQDVESRFRIDPASAVIIPNAVDLNHYDPAAHPNAGTKLREQLGLSSARKIGLFLSQDFVRKGLIETLQAVATLNDPSFVLVVTGREDPAPFQRLAARLGITPNVIFTPPTGDPYPFYAAADVVLFPSRFDSFGLVPAEAVAMGVPPIVSRAAGISELLTDAKNALVVEDPAQTATFTAAIRHALDPETHDRLSRGCLASRTIFSYDKHLDSIVALYLARKEDRRSAPKSAV